MKIEENFNLSEKGYEDIVDNINFSENEDDFNNDYKYISLFDRLLKDNRFINYKDILLDIKFKSQKRNEIINDDDIKDIPIIKKKMIYPKKIRI